MESNPGFLKYFRNSGGLNPGFLKSLKKYGGPNLGFFKYFQKYEVQIIEFYTNPRLGPDSGFWNGIFTRSTSCWINDNYKGDADCQLLQISQLCKRATKQQNK